MEELAAPDRLEVRVDGAKDFRSGFVFAPIP